MFIGLIILIGVAYYFTTAEERARALRFARMAAEQAYETCEGGRPDSPIRTALRERTPWALVTPALIFLNIATAAFMALGPGSIGDAQTLVAWGANTGPRTTNGEWQRLVTSMFVHAGMLQLLVNVAGLAALGFITERLAGSIAFAAVYLTAGLFASIVSLSTNPMGVSFGASGGILGIYGLLAAFAIRSIFREPDIPIPPVIVKRLGAVAGLFVFYNLLSGSLAASAELSSFAIGLVHGLFLVRGGAHARARLRPVAVTVVATLMLATGFAAPLSGIDDVRPEAESLIAIERRTADAYDVEVARYKTHRTSENALVQLIDGRILPELRAAAARLKAFDKVLPEQRQLIESANAYLRLREESWRLRAEGLRQMVTLRSRGNRELHTSSTLVLRRAETEERAALDALQGVVAANIR